MVCCLCLKNKRNSKQFGVFSEEGAKLNVAGIIAKHFWLQLNDEKQSICAHCWMTVREFHAFYQDIANAHKRLESLELVDIMTYSDSVTKSESKNKAHHNDSIGNHGHADDYGMDSTGQLIEALGESFFDSEVKVEVHDLDLLPQAEVIDDGDDRNHIKEELTSIGVHMEIELPLHMLVSKTDNIGNTYDDDGRSINIALSKKSEVNKLNDDVLEDSTQQQLQLQKRRRGRPRKCDALVKVQSKPKIKTRLQAEAKYQSNSIITRGGKCNDTENDEGALISLADQTVSAEDSSADSSSSSSTHSSNSDRSSLPDIEPTEQFAEIPKRVVLKPKKYRKRPKPLVPPRRMTREEIDRKNAQQAEYDGIIAQFFDKFPCTVCNLFVQSFGDMKRHFRLTHNIDPGYVMCCGRKFHLRKTLAEHVYVHWNPEHFKCGTCSRTFQDSRSLEVHEQTHTATEPKERKVFQCDKCPKSFTTKAAFEHHSFSKHVPNSEFKFTCSVCNKKMPTARKLRDHMKYTHDPESAVICDKCGKQMRSQSNLKKHHALEHSDGPRPVPVPVQCEICGTWLRHAAGLKQHMKTIHEDSGEEHRCHICQKTSTNARALKRHIYHNHLCERKFKCTMCEKAFKRPQDLREHTSTHTGEVLYTCPNCAMTFFSNANMYKHRQRLHRAEWEADRKKPGKIIMQQAVAATAAMKMQHTAIGPVTSATNTLFTNQLHQNTQHSLTTAQLTLQKLI